MTDLIAHAEAAPQTKPLWRVRPDLLTKIAMAFLAVLILTLALASVLPIDDPNALDLANRYAAPSSDHPLGTDSTGRDVLSRLIYGGRTSLLAGLLATAIAALVGIPLGILAGYLGGWTDRVLDRADDLLLSVPGIVLAMAFIATLGTGIVNAMIAVGIIFIPRFFRVARALTRSERESPYIEALVALGATRTRVIGRHLFPNVTSPLLVEGTTVFTGAILAEASLSFLGLGVNEPTSSWGTLLNTAQSRPDLANLLYPVGLALTLTVLSLTIVSDHLRDVIAYDGKDA